VRAENCRFQDYCELVLADEEYPSSYYGLSVKANSDLLQQAPTRYRIGVSWVDNLEYPHSIAKFSGILKMKRSLLWLPILIMLFSGQAQAEKPALTVGIYDNPPQVFQDAEGTPHGIYVDLISEIASLEGWNIKFVWGDWAKHLEALKHGKLDLITTIAYDADRDRYIDYSQEPVVMVWGQIYQQPSLALHNILDLEGKRIAVMQNGLFGIRLEELCIKFMVECKIVPVAGYREAMQAVSEGRVEAAAINSLFGYAFEHEFNVARSTIIYEPFGLRFATPEGVNANILAAIDTHLQAWRKDNNSFYFQTLTHYAGGMMPVTRQIPQELIWLLSMAGIAIFLFLLWSISLRTKVASRTKDLVESQNALRKSEAYIRSLFKHTPIGLALCDMQGELVEINPAYASILGRSEEETKKLTYWEITPEQYKEQEQAQLNLLERDRHYGPYEKEYKHRDGHLVPVRLSGRILEIDGKPHIWSSIEDISQQREIEQARIAQHQADSANKAKSAFLATMSHEIRTPLNSILGMGEILEDTELTETQKHLLNNLKNSGKQLLAIINDILDLSKIEAGQLTLERTAFDLKLLIDETMQIFAFSALNKSIKLKTVIEDGVPNWVQGDPTRTRQLLLNLIGNAIKFSQDGQVTVSVNAGSNECISFAITDTGPGIPKEKQDEIFQPFTQADTSTTRRHGGSGLGLSICQHLTDLMGGKIKLHSEIGQGSTFTLTIPLPESATPKTPSKSGGMDKRSPKEDYTASLQGLNILLVEDVEENQLVIKGYLRNEQCQIDIATNGLEAVEKFQNCHFDLVLMDIQMPIMDGTEATKRIRSWETETKAKPTPIIALTAHALPEESEQTTDAGCNLYLTKPVRKKVLIAALHDLSKLK
jgi:PAS domain S-box-containing protein